MRLFISVHECWKSLALGHHECEQRNEGQSALVGFSPGVHLIVVWEGFSACSRASFIMASPSSTALTAYHKHNKHAINRQSLRIATGLQQGSPHWASFWRTVDPAQNAAQLTDSYHGRKESQRGCLMESILHWGHDKHGFQTGEKTIDVRWFQELKWKHATQE